MRLTRIGLQSYGNFESLDIVLTAQPGQIDVLVAPNGAGKSVIRQAICELLFGIRPQTPMNFMYPYPRMRLSADAVWPDGTTTGFVRRKGDSNTLLDAAGAPAPAVAARLPGAPDRQRLERLFALDSTQLEAGGRALLAAGGDLADALLSGAGELRSARDVLAQLTEYRDRTAPRTKHRKYPFHEAGEAMKDAQRRLAAALVRPQDWKAREDARDAAAGRRLEANSCDAAAKAALGRLQRVRRTRHTLAALDAAEGWLSAHPHAPDLPATLGSRWADALRQVADATAQHAERRARAADLAATCDGQATDDAVLAEEAALNALAGERGSTRQSRTDTPVLRAEREAVSGVIAGLLRQLGSACDPDAAAREIRSVAAIEAARRLILQHAKLAADLTAGPGAMEQARDGIAAAGAELASLPVPAQTDALEALTTEITVGGQPDMLRERSRAEAAAAACVVAAALARVPGGCTGVAALMAMAAPSDEGLARLDAALQLATRALGQAATAQEDASAKVAALAIALREQDAAGSLPDRAAVARARATRDAGWAMVLARLDGAPVDPAAERRFAGDASLAADYAHAVAAADTLADRRADEADRVQRASRLGSDAADADRLASRTQDTYVAVQRRQAEARAVWSAACAAIGLPGEATPGEVALGEVTMGEARAFLAARVRVIDANEAAGRVAADDAALERRHTGWAARLAGLLDGSGTDISALLGDARRVLAEARTMQTRRAALDGTIQAAEAELRKQSVRQSAADATYRDWKHAWNAALAALGRPSGEQPDVTGPVLDVLVRLEAEIAKAAELAGRLAKMQAQLASFDVDARAALGRLGASPRPDADLIAAVEEAVTRLARAREQRSSLQTLRDQATEAAAALAEATQALAAAGRARDDLIRQAGATDGAGATERIALADALREHVRARQSALVRLQEDGDGLSPAAIRAQADDHPADALPGEIAAAEAAMQDAQAVAQHAAGEEARLAAELASLVDDAEAGRAAHDLAAAQSRLGHVLEDSLVHHVAAALLENALMAVETTGDDPRLARIGGVFAALTQGRYPRVASGEAIVGGKVHRVLLACDGAGDEKQIDQLSEGTRDQLYLALRLVAIEDHAASGAPALPFIADDILQTFDDGRALAAFHALATLSAHTQVIVLTHHDHLAVIAGLLPAGIARIQHLPV